ncbi:serine/threonine protein kinase [Haloferula chungangensis]|uniref:Serine/threonine protein kinase n=1 Tax=Haloferula chungangensis TaxID=1048331 RepID=A0ABW2L4B5_9BACT
MKREFGPYTLLRRHAIGGMSMVFVAQDNTLHREVVLKILSEEFSADEKRIAAFEEEARITAAIGHPHVVRVFTTGRAFGRFFIAMEFVQGGHYEHHIKEKGSIPEEEALPLMIEVAEGLNAAHAAGLIHRDIKPGNILLDSHGKAKIVDFGLALLTQGGMAQAEEIWATPYYVPPETIEGLPEDFRSDVYAFGATFHHALAGKPPCGEESMDTNRLRKAKQNIPPLASVAPWLSAATCAVIDRCMAYSAADRFDSYEELIAALRGAQSQLGSEPPAPKGEDRRKRSGSSLGEKAALAFAGLLILLAAGFAWKWINEEDDELVEELDESSEVVTSPDPVPSTDGGGGLRVASAYREASEALGSGDYERARVLFGEVRDDPDVLEPTGSWAACEVVVASYLDGRSEQAREDARRALDHVRSAKDLPSGIGNILGKVLERLPQMEPIKPPMNFDSGAGPRYLGWLMVGLKSWEQGMPELAIPYFKAVAEAPGKGNHAWLAPYSKIAGDYLTDYSRLKKAEPKSFNVGKAESANLLDDLRALDATLRTKGRARFNVRVWQAELEKSLVAPKETPGLAAKIDDATAFPDSAMVDLSSCRFPTAISKLKAWRPSDEDGEKRREALLTLAEAATTFLAELGERTAGRSDLELLSRDGRKFEGILKGDVSRPLLKSSHGEVSLSWSEIDPSSLIELHRELSQDEDREIDKLRRHEEAIAFDLLAGDRERGKDAGARLAEVSEPFGRRWMVVLPALDH